jgi:hypothetical protein
MKRRDTLALGAGRGAALSLRRAAAPCTPRPRRRPQGAARTPSRWPRPASTRRDQRPLLAHRHRAHLRGALRYDHLARPAEDRAPLTAGGACPRCRPTSAPGPCASARASSSPTTRPSRARSASSRRRLRLHLKRFADPANKSPTGRRCAEHKMLGPGRAARQGARREEALRLRHAHRGPACAGPLHLQFTLQRAAPALCREPGRQRLFGAVAREVVEFYGDKIAEHPVGTGPFRLAQWRRSSFIVLERNPNYREHALRRRARADDAEGQAIAQRIKGRRLPLVDRVEVSIIEEAQPRWLSFLNAQIDSRACRRSLCPWPCPAASWRPTWPRRACRASARADAPRS